MCLAKVSNIFVTSCSSCVVNMMVPIQERVQDSQNIPMLQVPLDYIMTEEAEPTAMDNTVHMSCCSSHANGTGF